MTGLNHTIHRHHRYATIYKHAYEILCHYNTSANYSIRLKAAPGIHPRSGNLPSADEVAVIIPGDGQQGSSHDIILHTRDGALHRINETHPAYIPLQYPLLFPYGEAGWHEHMKLVNPPTNMPTSNRLTMTRYVSFRIHDCVREYSALLRGGRLFQRYLVDMWAAADQQRLTYLRKNQAKLRADLYSRLEDAVNDEHLDDLNEIGQRVVLPSSYTGGPRHMQQQFQDSMAIAWFYKKVGLFMTVTANPEWPEISENLLPGQTAYDRPDLVSRIFHLKTKAMINDIFKNGVFGRMVAYVYTIEFQKRGLPHMHILIFLEQGDKLLTPWDIDTAIQAYWPDPDWEPLLFDAFKRCMIHGPCGAYNPKAPCMENGKCTKGYPKDFSPMTQIDEHGYPNYYHPNDNRSYAVDANRELMVDNRWIVPYNPYFIAKYVNHNYIIRIPANVKSGITAISTSNVPYHLVHSSTPSST
jgi:hypothetical protein